MHASKLAQNRLCRTSCERKHISHLFFLSLSLFRKLKRMQTLVLHLQLRSCGLTAAFKTSSFLCSHVHAKPTSSGWRAHTHTHTPRAKRRLTRATVKKIVMTPGLHCCFFPSFFGLIEDAGRPCRGTAPHRKVCLRLLRGRARPYFASSRYITADLNFSFPGGVNRVT